MKLPNVVTEYTRNTIINVIYIIHFNLSQLIYQLDDCTSVQYVNLSYVWTCCFVCMFILKNKVWLYRTLRNWIKQTDVDSQNPVSVIIRNVTSHIIYEKLWNFISINVKIWRLHDRRRCERFAYVILCLVWMFFYKNDIDNNIDRHTNTQPDRPTDRQTNKQIDKQPHNSELDFAFNIFAIKRLISDGLEWNEYWMGLFFMWFDCMVLISSKEIDHKH